LLQLLISHSFRDHCELCSYNIKASAHNTPLSAHEGVAKTASRAEHRDIVTAGIIAMARDLIMD
jgi:hypothetical protein